MAVVGCHPVLLLLVVCKSCPAGLTPLTEVLNKYHVVAKLPGIGVGVDTGVDVGIGVGVDVGFMVGVGVDVGFWVGVGVDVVSIPELQSVPTLV